MEIEVVGVAPDLDVAGKDPVPQTENVGALVIAYPVVAVSGLPDIHIVSGPAVETIVASPADKGVLASHTGQHVVSAKPKQNVVRLVPEQRFGALSPPDGREQGVDVLRTPDGSVGEPDLRKFVADTRIPALDPDPLAGAPAGHIEVTVVARYLYVVGQQSPRQLQHVATLRIQDRVVSVPGLPHVGVVAVLAPQAIVPTTALDTIVSAAAIDTVVEERSLQYLVLGTAPDKIDILGQSHLGEHVLAPPHYPVEETDLLQRTVYGILKPIFDGEPLAPDEEMEVVAIPPHLDGTAIYVVPENQDVRALAVGDPVVAVTQIPDIGIVSSPAAQNVVPRTADQGVVRVVPLDDVVSVRPLHTTGPGIDLVGCPRGTVPEPERADRAGIGGPEPILQSDPFIPIRNVEVLHIPFQANILRLHVEAKPQGIDASAVDDPIVAVARVPHVRVVSAAAHQNVRTRTALERLVAVVVAPQLVVPRRTLAIADDPVDLLRTPAAAVGEPDPVQAPASPIPALNLDPLVADPDVKVILVPLEGNGISPDPLAQDQRILIRGVQNPVVPVPDIPDIGVVAPASGQRIVPPATDQRIVRVVVAAQRVVAVRTDDTLCCRVDVLSRPYPPIRKTDLVQRTTGEPVFHLDPLAVHHKVQVSLVPLDTDGLGRHPLTELQEVIALRVQYPVVAVAPVPDVRVVARTPHQDVVALQAYQGIAQTVVPSLEDVVLVGPDHLAQHGLDALPRPDFEVPETDLL